jgi:hypothetical protein
MSTTDATVDRLTATLRLPPSLDRDEAGRWLARVQAASAGSPLERAFAAAGLPPGHWFLRRVDVPVVLDPARPELALADEWAARIAGAVRRAALAGGPHVVCYADEAAMAEDVVRGLSARDAGRAWAWRAAGVLRPADPDPVTRPAAVLLALARRRPAMLLVAVLNRMRAPGGPAGLDRILDPAGWVRLVEALVPEAAGWAYAATAVLDGGEPASLPRPVRARAARLVTASSLAAQIRRGPLRPASTVLVAWAILVLAEAEPGGPARPAVAGPDLVAAIAVGLAAERRTPAGFAGAESLTGTPEPGHDVAKADGRAPVESPPRWDGGEPPPDGDTTRPEPEDQADPGTEDVEGTEGWPTAWAGLPFLLAAAADAGLPDAALTDPRLPDRTLRWVLHSVAGLLVPARPDDAARLLLAGLTPEHAVELLAAPMPSDDERAALETLAAAWAAAVTGRLIRAGAEPDEATVHHLARRLGRVTGRPGWLEVHIPLDAVDVPIRRAGLDLDPGWVPWLGTVVRYRYG